MCGIALSVLVWNVYCIDPDLCRLRDDSGNARTTRRRRRRRLSAGLCVLVRFLINSNDICYRYAPYLYVSYNSTDGEAVGGLYVCFFLGGWG